MSVREDDEPILLSAGEMHEGRIGRLHRHTSKVVVVDGEEIRYDAVRFVDPSDPTKEVFAWCRR